MQNDLIFRSAVLKGLDELKDPPIDRGGEVKAEPALNLLLELTKCVIEEAPAVDAVSRSVFEQIKWERDCAIQQLKDHDIPFGGIAPDVVKVVRCCECIYRDGTPGQPNILCYQMHDDDFCSYGERRAKNGK